MPDRNRTSSKSPGKAQNPEKRAVKSAATPPIIDPDLAQVLVSWATLPAALKAGIVAMVKAAQMPEGGKP
jgi:hypothetical protein